MSKFITIANAAIVSRVQATVIDSVKEMAKFQSETIDAAKRRSQMEAPITGNRILKYENSSSAVNANLATRLCRYFGLDYESERYGDNVVLTTDVAIFTFEKDGNMVCQPFVGGLCKTKFSEKKFNELLDFCRWRHLQDNLEFLDEGISKLTVCRSAAGYYIGRLEREYGYEPDEVMLMPYSRESACYYSCFDDAYKALINNNYPICFW